MAASAATIGVTPALRSMEGSMTKLIQLAIEALILERSAALKLRRSDLVRRAGYKNVAVFLSEIERLIDLT